METNREILELIKATACKYLPDAEVMLFGSRARREATSDSDFDVSCSYFPRPVSQTEAAPQNKYQKRAPQRGDEIRYPNSK